MLSNTLEVITEIICKVLHLLLEHYRDVQANNFMIVLIRAKKIINLEIKIGYNFSFKKKSAYNCFIHGICYQENN